MLKSLKKMNGYYKIMLISLIITIISAFFEYKYGPLYPLKQDITSNIKRLYWRWLHWVVVLFVSFFFVFFDMRTLTKDIVIYYSFLLVTVIHWYTNICMISLLETKNYNVNPMDEITTNRPFLRVFFRNFGKDFVSNIFNLSTTLFTAYTLVYITLFTKKINKILKYSVFLIVLVAFYRAKTATTKKYTNGFLYDCLMANPFI